MSLLPSWSTVKVPIIGMLHSPPLLGSAGYRGDFDSIRQFVLRDAELLRDGGVDGLMLENFGDTPFYPDRVPAITVAAMTALAVEVRQRIALPLGINVLRNDGCSALAIAAVCGAEFIRVNVLCGARVTDQGLLQGIAHDLLRERTSLGCQHIRILADVDVKHSAPLAARPIEVETKDLVERAHADGVIVSGQATGDPTDSSTLAIVRRATTVPVFVGSGVAANNVVDLIQSGASGLIVGSSLKRDGGIGNPIDPDRVRELVKIVRDCGSRAAEPLF
jgi:membrane complex biogenesis BtpA family protein